MTETYVYYLSPDYVNDLPGMRNPEWAEELKNHGATQRFTLEEFQASFNDESISDLGYIAILTEQSL